MFCLLNTNATTVIRVKGEIDEYETVTEATGRWEKRNNMDRKEV